jgi:predicted nucleotide-binding protein (sugar kinase/HSP70/actin superfamily)
MIEVTIALGSLLFISLSILSVLSVKLRALKNNVKKLSAAYSKIEMLMSSKTKLDNDAHQESFIKFLSDSRDSAFEYIEEVQSGINEFVSEVDPLITYFDEYGDVMAMAPNYDNMKKISVEFKKLKKLLPEESK